MSKRVYISADYSETDGDRNVIDVLHEWGRDNYHKVDYIDTAEVVSGSVADDPDCRSCDLKIHSDRHQGLHTALLHTRGKCSSHLWRLS